MLTYSPTSAFWLFNRVANQCYLRYDLMSEDALKVQRKLESAYISDTKTVDEEAVKLYAQGENDARRYLTSYSLKSAKNTFDQWQKLSDYLLVKYIDGNIKKEKDGKFETTKYNYPAMPNQPGYPDSWKKSVIQDNGKMLQVPSGAGH
jgi:dipeptidase